MTVRPQLRPTHCSVAEIRRRPERKPQITWEIRAKGMMASIRVLDAFQNKVRTEALADVTVPHAVIRYGWTPVAARLRLAASPSQMSSFSCRKCKVG